MSSVRRSIYLGLFLFVVGSLCSVLITGVKNYATPILIERAAKELQETLSLLYENAEYENVSDEYRTDEYETIKGIYLIKENEEVINIVYKLVVSGRNNDITMLVAFDLESENVYKFHYLSQYETRGIGDRVASEEYINSIVEQSASSLDIDLISGATISSSAVRKALVEAGNHFVENVGDLRD